MSHPHEPPSTSPKFQLTLDDIEHAVVCIGEALPRPLQNLFADVLGTMTGGNQDIYATVGFGIAISRTVAGDWEISDYSHAVLTWHLDHYAPVPDDHPPYTRRCSDVVEAILRLGVTAPGDTRQEAADNLTAALTTWATATYEE